MSERPISGRPPRGSRPRGEDPSGHPQTEANEVGDDEELSNGSRSRSRQAPREVSNSTRIMSVDDVDGGESEEEELPDSEATHAGPPITVEIIEGPDAGKKKRVRGGRMVVGRGDGCDLKLRDTAASRRHLELIVGFSGCIVRDLGSGNGTKVNGEKVDEAQVGHGDEIVLGTTLLRIVDEVAALEERRRPKEPEPPPHVEPAGEGEGEGEEGAAPENAQPRRGSRANNGRAPGTEAVDIPGVAPRKRNPLVLAAIGGGVLLLLGVLLALIRPSAPPHPANEPTHDDVRAAKLMQQGKAALAAGEYDKADDLWSQIGALDPNNVDLPDLKERTKKERASKKAYQSALGMVAEHQFDKARDALKSVEAGTLVEEQAADLLKSLDQKQADFLLQTGEQKLALHDLEGARQVLPDLGRVSPAQQDKLVKEIEAAQAEADRRALAGIKNKKKREAMLRQMKARKAEEAVRKDLESGFRKFHEAATPGQYDRAATEFDRIAEGSNNAAARTRAKELAKHIRELSRYVSEADELDADQNYAAEVQPLSSALTALDKVEPNGVLGLKLKNRMVRGLVIKGRDAAARQDYGVAAKAFSKALQIKPGDPNAKDGMNNLRSRANEVYLQAYEEQERDPESAKKLFQAVMDMTPKGEELHEKASHRLKELNGSGDD